MNRLAQIQIPGPIVEPPFYKEIPVSVRAAEAIRKNYLFMLLPLLVFFSLKVVEKLTKKRLSKLVYLLTFVVVLIAEAIIFWKGYSDVPRYVTFF